MARASRSSTARMLEVRRQLDIIFEPHWGSRDRVFRQIVDGFLEAHGERGDELVYRLEEGSSKVLFT